MPTCPHCGIELDADGYPTNLDRPGGDLVAFTVAHQPHRPDLPCLRSTVIRGGPR